MPARGAGRPEALPAEIRSWRGGPESRAGVRRVCGARRGGGGGQGEARGRHRTDGAAGSGARSRREWLRGWKRPNGRFRVSECRVRGCGMPVVPLSTWWRGGRLGLPRSIWPVATRRGRFSGEGGVARFRGDFEVGGDPDRFEAFDLGGRAVLQGDEEGGDEVWFGEVRHDYACEAVIVAFS